MSPRASLLATLSAICLLGGCVEDLAAAPPVDYGQDFGQKFFNIVCQRVAYTSTVQAYEASVAANAADPSSPILPKDVSGDRYRLACRHGVDYLPSDATTKDPKVATLVARRADFVDAINLIFPGSELSDLQDYMVNILPLTDDGSFPGLIEKTAGLLKSQLEADSDLVWSLARLDHRIGYRPRPVCLGITREMLSYPKLRTLMNTMLAFVAEGGKAHQEFLDLIEAVAFELRTTRRVDDPTRSDRMNQSAKDRPLGLALDLLLTQSSAFASTGSPMYLVKRDWRGVAQVLAGKSGGLPTPFVDKDKDGLADINSLGQYVTSGTGSVPMPFLYDKSKPDAAAHRDASGRAYDEGGRAIYNYLNLDSTLLAALSRDALDILDPKTGAATKLVLGAGLLLGPRKTTSKTEGGETLSFSGFDTSSSPLLDLIWSVLQTLRASNVDDLLDVVKILFQSHEGNAARLVAVALDLRDRGKNHSEAVVDPEANLYDDLVVVLQKIANTEGLLEDVLHALADPRTKNLGPMIQTYFTYKDVHVLDSDYQDITDPTFKTKVDRTQSDSGNNRSIQQRLFHIINNTNGMKICNKEDACIGLELLGTKLCAWTFKECELFEIDNGAVFYLQSVARLRDSNGDLTSTPKAYLRMKTENMSSTLKGIIDTVGVDTVIGLMAGIDGMTSHPTTEALNRMMFMDKFPTVLALAQDPPKDIDGNYVYSYFKGSLLSWEVPHTQFSCSSTDPCQFYEAFRPVAQAFADHNAEKLFMDVISVIHRHWPSKKSTTHQFTDSSGKAYAAGSAAVTYEPLLIEILAKSDLMGALTSFAKTLDTLKTSSGSSAKAVLAEALLFFFDPSASSGMTYRSGRTTSLTTYGRETGDTSKKVSGGVSPYYLFADAFAAKRKSISSAESSTNKVLATAWNDSTSALSDVFLATTGSGSQTTFKNRRFPAAAVLLLDFLRARLKDHKTATNTTTWLTKELPASVERKLSSPVVARAADLVRRLEENTTVRGVAYDLIDYLIDEINENSTFRSSLTGIADLAQMLIDDANLIPLAKAVGKLADPKSGIVEAAIKFLAPAIARDTGSSLTKVLKNAYTEQSPGKSPVQTLLDLATDIHRLHPGSDGPYVGQDIAHVFHEARDFLENESTGLNKFFEIVQNRCGGPCTSE
jgi:hypothetical protein